LANIKSQIKRIRTNEAARQRNVAVRSALKTYARKYREAVASGDRTAAEAALRTTCRELDRAASSGVIHANTAAHRKSSLARKLNTAG